ncbi:hypothetical protein G7Y89_g7952 [Cudoniella acicularis]|uniref:Uncharacterized protein n=1 Tax=Cudoniella acicularis TaxID=354080 RepID=A0A8H4W1J8_9HELO|nr:hypothetical protein G7Y89_g7952 [Cudoniella acicularis]
MTESPPPRLYTLLDALTGRVIALNREVLSETGKLVITKDHWDRYHEFDAKITAFEPRVEECETRLKNAERELASLMINDDQGGASPALTTRVEKILSREQATPTKMVVDAAAILLRSAKSLDPVRSLHPNLEKLLFNFELRPLREENDRLKSLSFNSQVGGSGSAPVRSHTDDEYNALKRQLEHERSEKDRLLQEMSKRSLDASQRIPQTQFSEVANARFAYTETQRQKSDAEVEKQKRLLAQKDANIRALTMQRNKEEARARRALLAEDRANKESARILSELNDTKVVLQAAEKDLEDNIQLRTFFQAKVAETEWRSELIAGRFEQDIQQLESEISRLTFFSDNREHQVAHDAQMIGDLYDTLEYENHGLERQLREAKTELQDLKSTSESKIQRLSLSNKGLSDHKKLLECAADSLKLDIKKLQREKSNLSAEKTTLERERDRLIGEKKELSNKYNQLSLQRQQQQAKVTEINIVKGNIETQLQVAKEELAKCTTRLSALSGYLDLATNLSSRHTWDDLVNKVLSLPFDKLDISEEIRKPWIVQPLAIPSCE